MYAEQAEAARRQEWRLADGDTVNVAGYRRYSDLLRAPAGTTVGRAQMRSPVAARRSLVRPFVNDRWR